MILFLVFSLVIASSFAASPSLPTLYQIQRVHFTGPYSCIPGYNGSALFLSPEDERRNNPILLYYGNCPPQTPSFDCAMSGDSVATIADLGPVALTSFSANDAIFAKNFQVAKKKMVFCCLMLLTHFIPWKGLAKCCGRPLLLCDNIS